MITTVSISATAENTDTKFPFIIGDTTEPKNDGGLLFPIHDRRADYTGDKKSTYDFNLPPNITDSVVYDQTTQLYTVYEKIGNRYYRTPTTYTFDEYWKLRSRQAEVEYFRKRANTMNLLNRKLTKPKLALYDNLFNRLFGNGKIEITPQGNVDVTAGYQGQNIANPTLPERARKNGGFDFDMNAQVNVNANIGDKLKFPINYNTLANFGQDNQLKLDYTGVDDEIIKRLEAGNVSFPSRSTLIPGAQQLFGLKTQLQFGKLNVTAVLANQKSQRQSVNLQGGAASQPIELKADDYEENRHFLLGQYFKDNYNQVMKNLPAVTTPVQILRLEVWVTNRNGSTTDTRDVVGLMDLGERTPYRQPPLVNVLSSFAPPSNGTNDLYSKIISDPNNRNPAMIVSNLQSFGLAPVQDFEKTFARKLDSTQYIFNRQVGFISLSQPLQTDEVLAVAYQYSYNGKIYQVGEFSQDLPPDSASATQKVLFLKLLKATSQRTSLPIWGLMMKNVYSVGYGTLSPTDFKLNLLYQEPSLGEKRYVPFGDKNQGTPILTLDNLDRLNSQLDPQPDGVFDYVEGYTVLSYYSRIIFPVLQPFGRDLAEQIYTVVPPTVKDTLYYALYDSIKAVAQQYPNLNRFVMKGSARTSGSSDISIGYNIPRGSVTVTAGGQTLIEGTDYDINYDLGTIKITNQAVLNAGLPVQVNYENNAAFGIQQRNYLGLRLDYMAKNTVKEQLAIGGTVVRLGERPFFTKVNYNEDPIRNTMYGLDVNYRKEMPRLTKWLDKLPFYQTTVPSTINAYGEMAVLKPGHAPQIGSGSKGAVYIDDFEGSRSGIDLRFPAVSWALASTPQGATDAFGNKIFLEGSLNNNIDYGKNRAKIAWYQIEPSLQLYKGNNNPLATNREELSDPRVRTIYQSEIFPQRTTSFGQNQLVTFDLSYYPTEKGPYNFDDDALSVSSDGRLKNPRSRWGGLMRNIDQTDFETANIEFIEFWLQDPFINTPRNPNATSSTGGKLYFNLGNISEDILKDGRRFYENGLPTPNAPAQIDTSTWGKVPRNPIQVTNAFSNNADDRQYQDVGFDGLDDDSEIVQRQPYLNKLQAILNPNAYAKVAKDPSLDDYVHYRDATFTGADGILKRYKNFNNPQGNSKVNDGSEFSSAATLYPDAEDLNRDNTLNEVEEYFQYTVDIKPDGNTEMEIGNNFIVDKKTVTVKPADGSTREEKWYQFRIPINAYDAKIGNIPDFKSIRFIRMFLTDFEDSVTMRFGQLQLTRNIWRQFKYKVDTTGNYNPISSSVDFSVGGVSIEENDKRSPLPYRTPKDIQRQQIQSNNGVNLLQNEQSMTLKFCGLGKDDTRGVFQTFANRDLRQYRNLSMYLHAENNIKTPFGIKDKDLNAVIRIGTDFVNNYYEIKIPLYLTPLSVGNLNPDTDAYNDSLWRAINNLDVDLTQLTKLKQERNFCTTCPSTTIYRQQQSNGQTYSILGDPNLGEIRGVLISVENSNNLNACGEVWVNELRLTSIDEKGGWAAMGRVDMTLADLGTISASVSTHSQGFGTLEQRANDRYRDDYKQFDIAANLELGKLLPKKAAISIPVFASYSQAISKPEYDPYDMDIRLKDKLSTAQSSQRDSIRRDAIDFTSTKTLNFTNVRKNRTGNKKPKIYDISNFDASYSYINIRAHNPLIENNEVTRHRGGLGYNFAPQPKYIEPFKKIKFFKKRKTHWFDLVKDFNFNPVPSQLSFRADIHRQFGAVRPRSIGASKYKIPETYDKFFTFQRDYIMRWGFTRSLNFDLTATNNSRIDEPYGRLDTKEKKDTVRTNFLKGGRNTLYNQTANFSYTLPTSKFPLLDWTTVNLKYQATYRWIGASRLAVNLGNILENGQQREGTAQLDFTRLYNKLKFFRAIDQPRVTGQTRNVTTRTDTVFKYVVRDGVKVKEVKRLKIRKIKDKNAMPDVGTIGRIFGKLITSVKQVNVSLSENANTRLPGYTDSSQFVGQNWKSMAPGLDFVLGRQPDTTWLNNAAKKGLITKDSMFSTILQQSFDQRLTFTAQLEPIRDLTISINVNKTFNKNYSELFKDTTGSGNNFGHLSPYAGGGFDVSYIAYKTLFGKFDPNRVSQTFITFQNNRQILSERLGKLNPNSDGIPGEFYKGYNKYATDVLIPAFIAAYTGQDPQKVGLIKQSNPNIKSNPFKNIIPRPNWKIDYSGLSRIKGLDKIFTNFTVSHGYNGNLSMNGFTSALLYQDISNTGYPSFYDTISKNFVPYFLVPNITIQEQFAPMIGVDMMFTNQLQAKFEYAKSRTLSLSLIDFQLSETRSTEFSVGAGFRKRGLKLLGGFKLPKFLSKSGSGKLDNEINFRFDFKIRDNATSNSRLDQDNTIPTAGSKEITFTPTIDYFLNSRVNIKLFYDRRKVVPYVQSSAAITNTRAGVQVRISLAQ
ncbi:cell surface protein SprA [Ferruginibacter lapsinanis]|uniref:T9SS outer membrane translocon Sov/SprA n=1 Tax=Ferruginibacter lapsinanis TaxID=563172 RepID=UPI001E5223EA|nr:cell surface protein SprA [Ferruginibacter lapsinanis]UEG48492.1 cell surface protein SprA [Ferruginibacter lapsinanis]